jgi:glutathionylspermidine synthase
MTPTDPIEAFDSPERYDVFARRIVDEGILTDPWFDGRPRFREEPLTLSAARLSAMYRAAEGIAAVYEETCRIVEASPELLDSFFGLTPWQKAMWLASQPLWHGIARADLFVTAEGLVTAELNCDTPTGEAEATVLGALASTSHPSLRDPNARLGDRFCAMVFALSAHLVDDPGPKPVIGLVYPTELTEDLSLVRLYKRWFEARGCEVVLGSPYNLGSDDDGTLRLFDASPTVLLRHYKTDWWGERASAWDDEVIPDARPLDGPLSAVFTAMLGRRCAVVNPFGAVLPQNKRAMAFMWEHVHRFSPHGQEIIREHVPVTSRLETMHEEQLIAQQAEWVLKSDYGAEGDEVILGAKVTDELWRASLEHAREGHWIAQRYFVAEENAQGETENYGVFLVAGEASGIYVRTQAGPTDHRAVSVPVLVRE